MAQVERTQGYYAMLYIDVNKFKLINDTKGHQAGDEVLVSVAKAIMATIRKQETAARYGGDEFCILFPNTQAKIYVITVNVYLQNLRELSRST